LFLRFNQTSSNPNNIWLNPIIALIIIFNCQLLFLFYFLSWKKNNNKQYSYEFNKTPKKKFKYIKQYVLLFVIVITFWIIMHSFFIKDVPVYKGELNAIENANILSMWTWLDYGHYSRYSPTGLLGFGLIDRYCISPILGINFESSGFINANRIIYFLIIYFALISILTYRLCRELNLNSYASFIAATLAGIHKGWSYSFHYASIIAACIMVVYGICLLIFWIKYIKSGKYFNIVFYYLFLLLLVGSWEQWINLLIFIIVLSITQIKSKFFTERKIYIHGILIPLIIFFIYIAFRFPSAQSEFSKISEAQYVFSYPSLSLMIEDVVSNISVYVSSVISSVLFPWPMLSQSVIKNMNMDILNAYNTKYTELSAAHYKIFTDWYAGFLFGIFLLITIALLVYIKKNKKNSFQIIFGLLLMYTGFAMNLPIMYRTYFTLPRCAGLLGSKHGFSILGFSVLLGCIINEFSINKFSKLINNLLPIIIFIWIIFCNANKIILSYQYQWGVYPW